MKLFRRNQGLTYIEILIAATVTTLVVLSMINLIGRIYKGITSAQLKTFSMNIATETVESLKQYGFSTLSVTPDSCIPPNSVDLESMDNCSDFSFIDEIPFANKSFKVYKIIRWAEEDDDGNIVGKKKSELSYGAEPNLKHIKVIVVYEDTNMFKRTEMVGLLSNRDVPVAGSQISGRISMKTTGGPSQPPGQASAATVYVVGHPEYTSMQYDDSGNYRMDNVMPGTYVLYAGGIGFQTTYYTGNPLVVSDVASDYPNVDFICPQIDTVTVEGYVYYPVTYTGIPEILTVTKSATVEFYATGDMCNQTQDWLNPGYISSKGGGTSRSTNHNANLFTEFNDTGLPDGITITKVELVVIQNSDGSNLKPGDELMVNFCTNSNAILPLTATPIGTDTPTPILTSTPTPTLAVTNTPTPCLTTIWADGSSPDFWSGNATDWYRNQDEDMENATTYSRWNITDMYDTWTGSRLDALGAVINSQAHNNGDPPNFDSSYIDAAYLEVTYIYTTTETVYPGTITYEPWDCARIKISDDTSDKEGNFTDSDGFYSITGVSEEVEPVKISVSRKKDNCDCYYLEELITDLTSSDPTVVDLYMRNPCSNSTVILNGNVYNSTDRTTPIDGATVFLSDPADVSPTTIAGSYTFPNATAGSWRLAASKPGYKLEQQKDVILVPPMETAPNLYMIPVGSISGTITNEISGNPEAGINVVAFSSMNSKKSEATTDSSGFFELKDVPIGSGYRVALSLDDTYEQTYPLSDDGHKNITVLQGITTPNKNFRVKIGSANIEGEVLIDENLIRNGVMIVAYPSTTKARAHDFAVDSTGDTYTVAQTLRIRKTDAFYGAVARRDGKFIISAPIDETYDIYAYYSYITYTGNAAPYSKKIFGLYKSISNVFLTEGGSDGNDISAALSSWTQYSEWP